MISDKNRIYDGFVGLEGGVDGGRAPNLIAANQVASAENVTFRGGRGRPRPGWRQLTESFTNGAHGFDIRGVEIPAGKDVAEGLRADHCYKNHVFQTICAYSPHRGDDCLMALIGGRLFKIVPGVNSAKVTEVTVRDTASPYTNQRTRDLADGSIVTGLGLDVITSFQARFTPADVGAVIRCNKYPGGSTVIKDYIGPLRVRTTELASSIGSNIHFTVVNTQLHAPYRNYKYSPIAYMCQADKYLIAQDGIAKAIIYDGKRAKRSNLEGVPDTNEVPTGTMMAYGMGRLCVVVNDRDVAFGDLYGSHDLPDPADSIVLFTERNFIAEGFDAAIPFEQGVATGIQFFPQLDTSTGNGQLLVFAERGAASFFLSLPREEWKTSQFQILALLTTGMRGHRSMSVVNEDLWFRSGDGVRTYRQARSEATGWAHIPLSTNVSQFIDMDDGRLLRFASSIYFNNRILFTCSPTWNCRHQNASQPSILGRPYHNGMVVVDFNVISSFGEKYKPAWDGHWTVGAAFTAELPNVKIAQLVTGAFEGVTRAFAFGLVEQRDQVGRVTYQNQLFELSFDDRDDFDGSIPWEIVSRAYDFKGGQQSSSFTENELYDGDIWISHISQGSIQGPGQGRQQQQAFSLESAPATEELVNLDGRWFATGQSAFEDKPGSPPPDWQPNWHNLWETAIDGMALPPADYHDYPSAFIIDDQGGGFGCQCYKLVFTQGIRGAAGVTRIWWAVINNSDKFAPLTVVQSYRTLDPDGPDTPLSTDHYVLPPGDVLRGSTLRPQPEPPNPDINDPTGTKNEIQVVTSFYLGSVVPPTPASLKYAHPEDFLSP